MLKTALVLMRQDRRAPQGARGLKLLRDAVAEGTGRRAPQGARGLKFDLIKRCRVDLLSRPARGAWVEIISLSCSKSCNVVAPRKGRVG